MPRIKLKKLLSKLEESEVIKQIIGLIDTTIVIKDEEKVLYGEETSIISEEKYEIKAGGEIIGWVYGNKNAATIASLITYMGNSELEKKDLANETLDKYREINVLYNIPKKIASSLDLNIITGTVLYQAMKHIESSCASVILINEETGEHEVVSEFHRKPGLKTFIRSSKPIIKLDNVIIRNVILTGKAEIVNNVGEGLRKHNGGKEINSLICVPLLVKNKVIGIIVLGIDKPINYEAEDLNLLNTFALQASIAIENAKLYGSQKEAFFETVQALSDAIEIKDNYTAGHAKRVAHYSVIIGGILGLPRSELARLKLAALLHDIGKMGVSDTILLKKSRLSEEESSMMMKHVEYGSEILKNVKKLREIIPGVRGHHERYDGYGYPDALKGEDIPIIARIICVADYFDAMTTDRPYRKGYSAEFVLGDIKKGAGSLFDPDVVRALLKAINERKLI